MMYFTGKLYQTKQGLKRAMDAIVPGAFALAYETGCIKQGPSSKWFEVAPKPAAPLAKPNPAFLNLRYGDVSPAVVRETLAACGA